MTGQVRNFATGATRSRVRARNSAGSAESAARAVPVLGAVAKLRVSGSREERIAAIAALQRGRVSRRQLLAAGIGYDAIGRLVGRRALWPCHHGSVFAVGHRGPVPLGPETAALLAVREGAALSRESAAALWDLGIATDELIHVTVAGSSTAKLNGVGVHRTKILAPQDVRIRKGLPVTSPARTLFDCAPGLTARRLELGFDRALVARAMRPAEMAELLTRVRGCPGAPALEALLERQRGPGLTRSEAEELFLALVRKAGLPKPEVNVRIEGFEVDFLWRARQLVVEIDGFAYHSTQRSFERDHGKDAILRAAGLGVLRFTYWQVHDEPLMVVAGVAREL